jgi:plastocyanin
MVKKFIAIAIALVGLVVSACGGRMMGGNASSSAATSYVLPPIDSDLVMIATLPKDTIGEERPNEGLGSIKSVKWKAMLGGYTQQRYSQALGFPPGTKITIRNLSRSTEHTLDVVKVISGPPAIFPKNPNLSVQAHGGGKLEGGYASGPIKPGKSITMTLAKAGFYLIGCAFHYHEGMHDVLVVQRNAAPGPQATAPPTSKPTTSPTVRSSYYP